MKLPYKYIVKLLVSVFLGLFISSWVTAGFASVAHEVFFTLKYEPVMISIAYLVTLTGAVIATAILIALIPPAAIILIPIASLKLLEGG